jgi:hypothetical protein
VRPSRRLLSGLFFSLAAVVSNIAIDGSAAEPRLEVRLDPRVFGIEDAARLEVRILEPKGTPVVDLGELDNLEVVSGPSTSSEFSWVNGAATRAVSYNYVLQGVEVGAASVGPVRVKIGDTELRTEVVSAEVVPGSVAQKRPARRRSVFSLDPFEDILGRRQPARSARVGLRQQVSARQAALGQPVVATIVLDTTAGGVDGFEWVTAPSYPGWWAQRVEPPERIEGEVVEVDGVRYNRFTVARHVLVPLKAGRLVLPAVEARIGYRTSSVFAPQQVVERGTQEIVIEVSPRPQAPEGFSGAVGDLRYTAKIEPATIDFGESAVLAIELRGNGNLPLVEAPALWPSCSGCESYPPEEDSAVIVDDSGIHGTRTWRTTVVPREWGEVELEQVTLVVYDPLVGRYRQQTVGPFQLAVNPPPPTPAPSPAEEPASKSGTGVHEGSPPSPSDEDAPPPWAWILGALLLGLLAGGVVPMVVARRRKTALPLRRAGETPAERARELQVALERWWLDARTRSKGKKLEEEMQQVRRELEEVRFAPSRADHTETVVDLEERLRGLMRRA